MISYEKLVNYMTKIMEQDERDNRFSEAIDAYCTDGAPFITTTELAVDLLEELCDDTVDHWDDDEVPQSAKTSQNPSSEKNDETPKENENKEDEKIDTKTNVRPDNQNGKPVKPKQGLITKIQTGAQDLQAKQMKFMGQVKKVGGDVINAGRAVAQLPMNFVNGLKTEIKKLDTMDDNRRKTYMIEPGFRKKAVKNLKLAILYGSVATTNLALIPFTMMVRHFSKEKDKRIRNELVEDLKTEIRICEEKINDASTEGDKQAKYRLMRTRDQLNKELLRMRTNAKYI